MSAVTGWGFGDVLPIQIEPHFFQGHQNFLLVKLAARLVVVVVLDFLFEQFNDDFARGEFTFVDGQSSVILEKIGEPELGKGQNVCLQRTAN